jgi:hypothetical protein
MQKRWRNAFGSQATRFLNLKKRVEQLPELAEVIHKPGERTCVKGCSSAVGCSVRVEYARQTVKFLGHDGLLFAKQPRRCRVGHKGAGGRRRAAHNARGSDCYLKTIIQMHETYQRVRHAVRAAAYHVAQHPQRCEGEACVVKRVYEFEE